MSFTVHLTKNADHREISLRTPTLVFETDGICAFFQPTFDKLGELTGKYVDPYDGGPFNTPEELDALQRVFSESADTIKNQPEVVRVKTGTRLSNPPEELFEEVDRSALEQLAAGILEFISRAKVDRLCVYFYGD